MLAVLIHGASIADASELSLTDARAFMDKLHLTDREAAIAAQVLREIKVRLDFLIQVGLNYLNLSRARRRCPAARRSASGWPRRSGRA